MQCCDSSIIVFGALFDFDMPVDSSRNGGVRVSGHKYCYIGNIEKDVKFIDGVIKLK